MANGSVGEIYYSVTADTSALLGSVRPADKALDGLNNRFAKTGKAANDANFKMKETSKAVKGLGQQANQTGNILRGMLPVLSAALLVQTAKNIIGAADAWTEMQNRLRQVTSSQKELNQATDDVFRIAQATSQALEPVAQVYQRLGQNAERLGLSQEEVADTATTVSKAVAASGASATAADAALRQLGQALASGTLRGDELNSIMEQTPALAGAIATGLGVTIGELRTLGAEGKITAKALIDALTKAGDSVNQQFGTRVKTASQAWVELRNSISRFIGEANNSVALTNALASGIERVSKAIDSVDIDHLTQEVAGLSATIQLVTDGADALFGGMSLSAQSATNSISGSFTEMALATAKEADGIAKVFQGTAGAVSAVWEALANNIPAFFNNAWGRIKQGAAEFVNELAETINKPIKAFGGEGIGKIAVEQASIQAITSLSDAAAEGWAEAAKGVGAYDRTLRRVTDNAINSSIADWQAAYTEEVGKTAVAAEGAATSSGKLSAAQRQEAKAHEANKKVLEEMVGALMLAGTEGESFAVAKAAARLNVFATPEEVEQVKALAAAMYQVQQAKSDQALINSVNPMEAEQEKYDAQVVAFKDMLERKRISQEEFNAYMAELKLAHDETMAGLTEENWALAQELETARYDTDLAELTTQLMNEEIAYADYYTRLEALQGEHAKNSEKIEKAKYASNLQAARGSFGAILGVMAAFGSEQNDLYRAMFVAAQSFAVAHAILSQKSAILKAWDQPFPANLAAVALVAAETAPLVSAIGSASMGGRQYGGPVAPSGMYRVNEGGKPEILNMANGQQFLLPNSRGEVVSNRDATRQGGSAGTTIINNLGGIHVTAAWPLPDNDVRRLVDQINDALSDGMILGKKNG